MKADPAKPPVDPGNAERFDIWGPDSAGPVTGWSIAPAKKPKPWGAGFTLWFLVALIGAQVVVLTPVLLVLATLQHDLDLSDPTDVERLSYLIGDVAMTGPGLVAAMLSQWVSFVFVPWIASRLKGWNSLRKDFGFWFKKSDLAWGLGLAVAIQAFMMGLSLALQYAGLDTEGADNTGQVTDHRGLLLVFMIFGAAIMAPVTEELLFRGVIFQGMMRTFARVDFAERLPGITDKYHDEPPSQFRRKVGTVAALLLSSAVFGLMHFAPETTPDGEVIILFGHWMTVIQTGLIGLVLAVVTLRTKRLGLSIMTHLYFNSISLALVFILAAR